MSFEEGVGTHYALDAHLRAQAKTRAAVEDFASRLTSGISEDEGHRVLRQTLEDHGAENFWHPQKLRFGANTTKSFREVSEPGVILREEDIFFVDVGPVFGGFEGDFGRTYVRGRNADYEAARDAAEKVFAETAAAWKRERLSGSALYARASESACQFGFEMDLRMNGHRVGDFPHALHHKGKLQDFAATPSSNLWILEILIRHPSGRYGAFFEDLLA